MVNNKEDFYKAHAATHAGGNEDKPYLLIMQNVVINNADVTITYAYDSEADRDAHYDTLIAHHLHIFDNGSVSRNA